VVPEYIGSTQAKEIVWAFIAMVLCFLGEFKVDEHQTLHDWDFPFGISFLPRSLPFFLAI